MLLKSALRALCHFKLLVVWLSLMLKTLVYSNKWNKKVYRPVDEHVFVENTIKQCRKKWENSELANLEQKWNERLNL